MREHDVWTPIPEDTTLAELAHFIRREATVNWRQLDRPLVEAIRTVIRLAEGDCGDENGSARLHSAEILAAFEQAINGVRSMWDAFPDEQDPSLRN